MGAREWVKGLVVDVIADQRTQDAVVSILGRLITSQILPLLPVASSAAAKAAVDEIVAKVPALEGVVDLAQVADKTRNELNALIPDFDFGIPALDNLIDFWRPKQ